MFAHCKVEVKTRFRLKRSFSGVTGMCWRLIATLDKYLHQKWVSLVFFPENCSISWKRRVKLAYPVNMVVFCSHTFCLILGESASRRQIIEQELKINLLHQLLPGQQFVPVYVLYDSVGLCDLPPFRKASLPSSIPGNRAGLTRADHGARKAQFGSLKLKWQTEEDLKP